MKLLNRKMFQVALGALLTLGGLVGVSGVASATTTTNTVAPVASGSYEVDGTVSVTNGTWTNAGTNFMYAWYTCTTNTVSDPTTDAGCALTAGASNTHLVDSGDIDQYLYAVVTVDGSNGSGSFSAVSNPLGQVAAAGSILSCGFTPNSVTLSPSHPTQILTQTADAYNNSPDGTNFGAGVLATENGNQYPLLMPATLIKNASDPFTFDMLSSFLNGHAGSVEFDFYAIDANGVIGNSLCHITFSLAASAPPSTFKPGNFVVRSFASGSAQMTPLLKYEVNRIATKIVNYVAHHGGTISVKLTGYADVTGTSDYNVKLSDARAKAVKTLLLADLNRHHVTSSIVTVAKGSSGHAKSLVNSRRVTVFVKSVVAG